MKKLKPCLKGLIVVGVIAIIFCIGVTSVYATMKTTISSGWSVYFKFNDPTITFNVSGEEKTVSIETDKTTYGEILDEMYNQGKIEYNSANTIGWYIDEDMTQPLNLDNNYVEQITIYTELKN